MINDTKWTEELIENIKAKKFDELIQWIGNVNKIEEYQYQKDDFIYFINPHNLRINRIIINLVNGKIDRVGIESGLFKLPFNFIQDMFEEYKRTFNTYDAIEDEQFMFYPGKEKHKIVAIESWIPEEEQNVDHEKIEFKNISLYFSEDKIPYHYRDGWHLETKKI